MIDVNKNLHHCYQTLNQLLKVVSLLASPIAVDIIEACKRDEGAAHAPRNVFKSSDIIHQAVVSSPVAVGAGEALSADPEHGVLAAADLARAPGTHALGGARGVGHQAEGARGGRGREARVPGDIEPSDQAKAHWHKGSVAQIYIHYFRKVIVILYI